MSLFIKTKPSIIIYKEKEKTYLYPQKQMPDK